MKNYTRREWIRSAAALAAAGPAARAWDWLDRAALTSRNDRVLVVLQWTGGNDGLNTCIPFRDDLYYKNRPRLRVDRSRVIPLDDQLALHPSLGALRETWDRGELCIATNVGYPRPDRSHFRSMEIWQSASLAPLPATGWIGRACDDLQTRRDPEGGAPVAIHVGSTEQPLALVAERAIVPSLVDLHRAMIQNGAGPGFIEAMASLQEVPRDGLGGWIAGEASSAWRFSRELRKVAERSVPSRFPATPLGRKLATVASCIRAGLATKIYYVEQDGFDTHASQPETHALLLEEFAGATASFFNDLRDAGHADRVATVAWSEFGRRVRENASGGTDHGAAGPIVLVGPGIQGGVCGSPPDLASLDDGDVAMKTDFREIYAAMLLQWLEVSPGPVLGGEFAPSAVFRAKK
jgi:uncharacterized protein (DUF1501 family)